VHMNTLAVAIASTLTCWSHSSFTHPFRAVLVIWEWWQPLTYPPIWRRRGTTSLGL